MQSIRRNKFLRKIAIYNGYCAPCGISGFFFGLMTLKETHLEPAKHLTKCTLFGYTLAVSIPLSLYQKYKTNKVLKFYDF